jgi:hypothetical protein
MIKIFNIIKLYSKIHEPFDKTDPFGKRGVGKPNIIK